MLREARERFPGLTFESSTRHVGFGLVIEEARVRDVAAEAEAALAAEVDEAARAAEEEVRSPRPTRCGTNPCAAARSELVLWNEAGQLDLPLPPVPLNMPVRVTVRHDDLQVHEVVLSFPAALLKRALGQYVDPLEMSLSEVQSAFIAPAGAGLTTHALAGPELSLARTVGRPAPDRGRAAPRRQAAASAPRCVLLVLLVLLVLALLGGRGLVGRPGRAMHIAGRDSVTGGVLARGHGGESAPTSQRRQPAASSKAPTVTRTPPARRRPARPP